MLILDLQFEQLAIDRQHGLRRDAVIERLLRASQLITVDGLPTRRERERLSPATRFLANLAAFARV